jgi:hypothetical protein
MRRGRFVLLSSLFLVLFLVALSVILQSCAPPTGGGIEGSGVIQNSSAYMSDNVLSKVDTTTGVACYWLEGWPGETFQCISYK